MVYATIVKLTVYKGLLQPKLFKGFRVGQKLIGALMSLDVLFFIKIDYKQQYNYTITIKTLIVIDIQFTLCIAVDTKQLDGKQMALHKLSMHVAHTHSRFATVNSDLHIAIIT